MRISYRIILINFTIVVLLLGASGIAFYSIMFKVLTSEQTKQLTKASNDFIFHFHSRTQDADESFSLFLGDDGNVTHSTKTLDGNIDFFFKVRNDSLIYPGTIIHKDFVKIPPGVISAAAFRSYNPFAVIKKYVTPSKEEYHYGFILNEMTINTLSRRTGADIGFFLEDNIAYYSNEEQNQKHFFLLNKAFDELNKKSNFEIFTEESGNTFFIASIYQLKNITPVGGKMSAIIFNISTEMANLRETARDVIIILGLTSIALSMVLTLLFTGKIRKQIKKLNEATEITKKGIFQNRLVVESKDELGDLAVAFNSMLDELSEREKAESEYTEFITLINQNPTITDIAGSALRKIISTTSFTVGAIYSVDDEVVQYIVSLGVDNKLPHKSPNYSFYQNSIKKMEPFELELKEKPAIIETGLTKIEIRFVLIFPVIYNNKVIALLELGAVNKPGNNSFDYIERIKEQLAIGIVNALAFQKLENLVSELKKLNEEYQKQNVQVKNQNETLIRLHNELKEKADELEIQKLKAEESTVLKSQFLALMSHELKTPLNAILGLTELILHDNTISNKNHERLSVVLRSSKRLINLINDILIYSKIESGKMDTKLEIFNLDELLDEIFYSATTFAEEKKLAFRIKKEYPEGLTIKSDRVKILQILLNLIENGIKFTDEGFVELSVRLYDNNRLLFKVIDSGRGISEEEQKIIFEEFRQVDSSTTRRYSGTGLGLSICKKFAELLSGKISVVSEPGKGSSFSFQLPVELPETISKVIELEEQQEINVIIPDGSKLRSEADKKTILIVDDDPDTLFTLNEIVEKASYKTMIARNGKECLEILEKENTDLILLDIMMPVMDGFQAIKKIRKNSKFKTLPVFAITAKAMHEDKETIFKYGFTGLILKPINQSEMLDIIQDSLNKKVG
ncbi:MAG TPA: ATP-binding protein [Ignavibacteriaceae bacterium]|nr:ATP-binding protein [Ignavibacteriaceae bacterium]